MTRNSASILIVGIVPEVGIWPANSAYLICRKAVGKSRAACLFLYLPNPGMEIDEDVELT